MIASVRFPPIADTSVCWLNTLDLRIRGVQLSPRVFFASAIPAAFKMFVMATYSIWAFKLSILDSDTHPLFALVMVSLSIYGLWVVVKKLADYAERAIEGELSR